MEQRIIDLEIKLSFLEQTLESLNEVILEQAASLDLMRKQLERLEQREGGAGEETDPQDERPPHY